MEPATGRCTGCDEQVAHGVIKHPAGELYTPMPHEGPCGQMCVASTPALKLTGKPIPAKMHHKKNCDVCFPDDPE